MVLDDSGGMVQTFGTNKCRKMVAHKRRRTGRWAALASGEWLALGAALETT